MKRTVTIYQQAFVLARYINGQCDCEKLALENRQNEIPKNHHFFQHFLPKTSLSEPRESSTRLISLPTCLVAREVWMKCLSAMV